MFPCVDACRDRLHSAGRSLGDPGKYNGRGRPVAVGGRPVEAAFLATLHAEPNDETTWLALADWLEEDGQADRAELVRLVRRLRTLPVMSRTRERARLENRVAELLDVGVPPVVPEVVNSIGMRLALIPPGRFRMGSPDGEAGRGPDEGPLHEVEITWPFYLGIFPLTQDQYQDVMGSNPSYHRSWGGGYLASTERGMAWVETENRGAFPVEQVSWEDAMVFCDRLSEQAGGTPARFLYRLPSEAEWEYCCRGGACSSTPFHIGRSLSSSQANFNGDPYGGADTGPSLGRACRVGCYRPNAFGLYDMHGNVWEWCSDWYGKDYYKKSPTRNPQGPVGGSSRMVRGGGWDCTGEACRAAQRFWLTPGFRSFSLGFRVAAVPHE
jgi:uncharacterized protein (TIGR02996 family)